MESDNDEAMVSSSTEALPVQHRSSISIPVRDEFELGVGRIKAVSSAPELATFERSRSDEADSNVVEEKPTTSRELIPPPDGVSNESAASTSSSSVVLAKVQNPTGAAVNGTRRNGERSGTGMKGGRKHRRRRGKKWKPYSKLSYEEKLELEKREERRAEGIRAERFKHGIPVAPYNTTQFLLEDRQARTEHDREDVDEIVQHIRVRQSGTGSSESGNDMSGSSGDESESEFDTLERDFSEAYQTAQSEHLQNLSKAQLIADYLALQTKLDAVQTELHDKQDVNVALSDRVNQLETEVDRLKTENASLKRLSTPEPR